MNTLISGALKLDQEIYEQLVALGLNITYHQDESVHVIHPEEYDAVVCNGLFLYNPMEQFVNLKLIQLTSAGFDRVSLDYIQRHSIKLYNASGTYSVPMAEYALCGVLQLYKQARFYATGQQSHCWEKHRGMLELAGRTVCVVGTGSIGIEVAKRFAAFDTKVIGIDIYPREIEYFSSVLTIDELNAVLAISDIIVLALPLTKETHHLFDETRISRLKAGAVFVNIARGGLVDERALEKALKSEKICGAVLDVFESEPLESNNPLWDMENVIVTPHSSFIGNNNQRRLFKTIVNNFRGFLQS